MPLKASLSQPKPILKDKYLQIIFSDSIQVIINYNTKLLKDLKPRLQNWTPSSCIGDIFIEIVSLSFFFCSVFQKKKY